MNRKGFTLVEFMLALSLSIGVVGCIAFLSASAVTQPVAQAEMLVARMEMEELAAELSSASHRAERVFVVEGEIRKDGAPWPGGATSATVPLDDNYTVADYLVANGMTVSGGDTVSAVLVGRSGWASVLSLTRVELARGLEYRVSLSPTQPGRRPRRVTFLAEGASLLAPDQPAPSVVASAGAITVSLPNPACSTPQYAHRAEPITAVLPVVGR